MTEVGLKGNNASLGTLRFLMSQSKYWVFTINNYTDDDLRSCESCVCSYICYGLETGEECNTPHIQGYVEFDKKLRMSQVSRMLPRARLEQRAKKATSQQNRTYCSKGGQFTERGEISVTEQGKRSDLKIVGQMLLDGASVSEIRQQFPHTYIQYQSGIKRMRAEMWVDVFEVKYGPWKWDWSESIESLLVHGGSNIGKTEWAKSLLPKALIVRHMDELAKYDSEKYHGIIFDDMSFNHTPREAQIHLLDWDNNSAIHIRYGTAWIPKNTPKIFTANYTNIFTDDPAINRRLKKYYCI